MPDTLQRTLSKTPLQTLLDPPPAVESRSGALPVVAVGLATTVAMWTVGYVSHLPLIMAPPWVTLAGLVLCVFLGGAAFGRYSRRGIRAAIAAAMVAVVVNLLILGSLLNDPTAKLPSPVVWLPGFAAAAVGLFLLGRRIGESGEATRAVNWGFVLAMVAVAATGLLVVAGGLVTGYDAGLSVPDWPNSFSANMFLYPLSRMTGAIYYEHAHRLFGSLVGLVTIILAVMLWPMDRRKWWRAFLVAAVLAVIVQGTMGGLRVTLADAGEHGVALSGPGNENVPSMILRVSHGVFGQMFLGMLAAIAVFTTDGFRRAHDKASQFVSPVDRRLGILLVLGLLVQLTLGAILRHIQALLILHISFAAVVLTLAVISGIRVWGLYGQRSDTFRRLGLWMIATVLMQLVLGILALVAIQYKQGTMLSVNAFITTVHQAVGATLLCLALVQTLWCARMVRTDDATPATEPLRA